MVLTIGTGWGLSAPTTHTPTATYDPNTGLMVVTINNHGFVNGDQVKFADNSITFSCAFGGANGDIHVLLTTHQIDGYKYLTCTTNTFTVQVLDTIPSTNVKSTYICISSNNGVKFAVSTVRIANESLQFSCPYNGGWNCSISTCHRPNWHTG